MRRLWNCKDWSIFADSNCRKGIRLRFDKEVDKEVRRACKEYVCWLRTQYDFPVRVPIYLKASKYVTTSKGEKVSAVFFGPYDKSAEPYIKVSVGDYHDLLEMFGKDNALAAILHSITHELSHYFQWIKHHEEWINAADDFFERQAKYYATEIIYDYAEVREHP